MLEATNPTCHVLIWICIWICSEVKSSTTYGLLVLVVGGHVPASTHAVPTGKVPVPVSRSPHVLYVRSNTSWVLLLFARILLGHLGRCVALHRAVLCCCARADWPTGRPHVNKNVKLRDHHHRSAPRATKCPFGVAQRIVWYRINLRSEPSGLVTHCPAEQGPTT